MKPTNEPPPAGVRELHPGDEIAGRYRVRGRLGRGGTGDVYEIEDQATGRTFALKVLRSELVGVAKLDQRFEREARATSFLQHPGIAQAFEYGRLPSGEPFIVMEHVAGVPLVDLMAGDTLDARRGLAILRDVLETVAHAHDRGVVHRDLKPDNVMVHGDAGDRPVVKLLDFGLAKLFGVAEEEVGGEALTQVGVTFGTPRYMAPEQVLGQGVDARADLYAVGVMAFEVLAGAHPFGDADPTQMLRLHLTRTPPTLAAVSGRSFAEELEAFVARALAKERGERFGSAREMLEALDRALPALDRAAVAATSASSLPAGPSATTGAGRTGTVIDGRYRILERIAAGGMGEVYRAERLELGRVVAVKFLSTALALDEGFLRRFRTEAQAMSRLGHPHCVSVIDYGVADTPWLVMDYVPGETLRAILARGRLPVTRALRLARQVLAGMAHAHEREVIHRDVKASNVIVERATGTGDHARLVDFGLARLQDTSSDATAPGIAVGTPSYMAPEQILGGTIDARTDVYSAGVLLFELLTGRLPFVATGSSFAVVRLHLDATPPRLAEIAPDLNASSELEAVIARALAKRPEDRFASAAEMAAALEDTPEVQRPTEMRISAPAVTPAGALAVAREEPSPPAPRGHRRELLAALVVVVLCGLAMAAVRRGSSLWGGGGTPGVRPSVAAGAPGGAERPGDGAAPVTAETAAPVPDVPATATAGAGAPGTPAEGGAPAGGAGAPGAGTGGAGPGSASAPTPSGTASVAPAPGEPHADATASAAEGEDDEPDEPVPADEQAEPIAAVQDGPVDDALVDRRERRPAPAPAGKRPERVADVIPLIEAGRHDDAIAALLALKKSQKRSAYIPYLLGNLYFEKRWWTDGMQEYREAIKKHRGYRRRATLVRNVIRALGASKTAGKATRLLVRDVGRSALPHLRRAMKDDPSPVVRARAGALVKRLAKRRGRSRGGHF